MYAGRQGFIQVWAQCLPCARGEHPTLGAGVGTSPWYTNGEGVADPPSPLKQSRDSWTLSCRHTWLCCLSKNPSVWLACASNSQRLFFFHEICSTALPVELLLFIGTGPGRPGRNYLSLGHAWCLAEHTASRFTGAAEGQGDSQSTISFPPIIRPHPLGLLIMDSSAARVQVFLSTGHSFMK